MKNSLKYLSTAVHKMMHGSTKHSPTCCKITRSTHKIAKHRTPDSGWVQTILLHWKVSNEPAKNSLYPHTRSYKLQAGVMPGRT